MPSAMPKLSCSRLRCSDKSSLFNSDIMTKSKQPYRFFKAYFIVAAAAFVALLALKLFVFTNLSWWLVSLPLWLAIPMFLCIIGVFALAFIFFARNVFPKSSNSKSKGYATESKNRK